MTRTDLPRGHGLTMASEDYLESIYRIMAQDDSFDQGVRSVEVADQLGVSKASVSKALSILKDNGMVEQVRYGRVLLTKEGMAYARRVWRSHRVLRTFLAGELGVDEQVADEEACLMEHYLSDDTIGRWCDYLERHGVTIED